MIGPGGIGFAPFLMGLFPTKKSKLLDYITFLVSATILRCQTFLGGLTRVVRLHTKKGAFIPFISLCVLYGNAYFDLLGNDPLLFSVVIDSRAILYFTKLMFWSTGH